MQKPNLTGEQIKAKLLQVDTTLSDIAAVIGCTHSHVSNVIHRRSSSIKIAKAICSLLQLPLDQVFGDVSTYSTSRESREKRRAEIKTRLKESQVLQ